MKMTMTTMVMRSKSRWRRTRVRKGSAWWRWGGEKKFVINSRAYHSAFCLIAFNYFPLLWLLLLLDVAVFVFAVVVRVPESSSSRSCDVPARPTEDSPERARARNLLRTHLRPMAVTSLHDFASATDRVLVVRCSHFRFAPACRVCLTTSCSTRPWHGIARATVLFVSRLDRPLVSVPSGKHPVGYRAS